MQLDGIVGVQDNLGNVVVMQKSSNQLRKCNTNVCSKTELQQSENSVRSS